MKTVLAAIDLSPVSDLVVEEAALLARALRGKVVLLTVLVEPVFVKEYAPPPRNLARITVEHERAVRQRLGVWQEKLQADFVETEVVIRRGGAAGHILAAADAHDAAFIVIGAHGHTAFFELVLGSTTQAVLKRARRPVVVIPHQMRKPRRTKVRVVTMPAER